MEGMEVMVKRIMRDPLFMAQKSVDATESDKQVVTDLLDTLRAKLDYCIFWVQISTIGILFVCHMSKSR